MKPYSTYDCMGVKLRKPLREFVEEDFAVGSVIITNSGRIYTKFTDGWGHGDYPLRVGYSDLSVRAIYDVKMTTIYPLPQTKLLYMYGIMSVVIILTLLTVYLLNAK